MNAGTIEVYRPRDVSVLGDWDIGGLKLKAYGLAAVGRHVDDAMVVFAQSFVRQDVISRVAAEGDSNGLGFVIIHAGSLGISISAHWWIQGSVLCQHNYRKLYSASEPTTWKSVPLSKRPERQGRDASDEGALWASAGSMSHLEIESTQATYKNHIR
ncbi:hypothetical protein IB267_01810 [Ensifer sp. ENS09]|uniref:hypothetical protein n=1 Tax=Ensifer sp. ENS09 TaxID=2769263 RepID=UPI001781F473|nr:hypothetical protein [Ensifer sp. ENS09]MBD9647080.1 hypothetical protein [Ensifer sp. ENS09]